MKKLFFLILMLPFTKIGAQTIEGRVVNNENKPIPNCIIHFNYSDEDYFTDEEGIFKFRHTKKILTSDSVIFSCLGYNKKTVAVNDLDKVENVVKLEEDVDNALPVMVITQNKRRKYKIDVKGIRLKLIEMLAFIFSPTKQFIKCAIDFSIDEPEILKEVEMYVDTWKDPSQVVYILIAKKHSKHSLPDSSDIVLKKAVKIEKNKGWATFFMDNLKLEKGDYFLIVDFSKMNFSDKTRDDFYSEKWFRKI